MFPYFMAKTGAFLFFTFAVCALAATFAQINPIWIYGPYNPVAISAGSSPTSTWASSKARCVSCPPQWVVFGHTFGFNVFIPALVPLGIVLTGAAYGHLSSNGLPATTEHHVDERPRNAPISTALGIAMISFYGLLWLEGPTTSSPTTSRAPLHDHRVLAGSHLHGPTSPTS